MYVSTKFLSFDGLHASNSEQRTGIVLQITNSWQAERTNKWNSAWTVNILQYRVLVHRPHTQSSFGGWSCRLIQHTWCEKQQFERKHSVNCDQGQTCCCQWDSVVGACSDCLRAEYFDQLLSVSGDVSFHQLHARTKQSLERCHVQHWTHSIYRLIYNSGLVCWDISLKQNVSWVFYLCVYHLRWFIMPPQRVK